MTDARAKRPLTKRFPIEVSALPNQIGKEYVQSGQDGDILSHECFTEDNYGTYEVRFKDDSIDQWQWKENPKYVAPGPEPVAGEDNRKRCWVRTQKGVIEDVTPEAA